MNFSFGYYSITKMTATSPAVAVTIPCSGRGRRHAQASNPDQRIGGQEEPTQGMVTATAGLVATRGRNPKRCREKALRHDRRAELECAHNENEAPDDGIEANEPGDGHHCGTWVHDEQDAQDNRQNTGDGHRPSLYISTLACEHGDQFN